MDFVGPPTQLAFPPPIGSSAALHRSEASLERRIAWLEEDVAVLHRRLRDECEKSAFAGSSPPSEQFLASDGTDIRDVLVKLDREFEGRFRCIETTLQTIDVRLSTAEETVVMERQLRIESVGEMDRRMNRFSEEIEQSVRLLISRIDDSFANASSMGNAWSGSAGTEARLRSLMRVVDEGLASNVNALNDAAGREYGGSEDQHRGCVSSANSTGYMDQVKAPSVSVHQDSEADELIRSWERLRQENQLLRERQSPPVGAQVLHTTGLVPALVPTVVQTTVPAAAVPVQVHRQVVLQGVRPVVAPAAVAGSIGMPRPVPIAAVLNGAGPQRHSP